MSESPFKKFKQTGSTSLTDAELSKSIQEQQKAMQNLVSEFRQQKKNQKNAPTNTIELDFDFSKLNEIEKQIKIYTTDKTYSSSENNWQLFFDLVLIDHVLTGKYGQGAHSVVSVKFLDDDETVIEVNCRICPKDTLWCEHVGSLLFSYSRSPETVLRYEELREKMKISPKNMLIRAILNMTKKKPGLLSEIEIELKNLEDNFEEESEQKTQTDFEKEKEIEDEALDLLPIVEVAPNVVK